MLCLLLGVLAFLRPSAGPAARSGATVVVTTRALRPGAVVTVADVRAAQWPADTVPTAALERVADVVGHPVGAAMARGEPVTTSRLLNTSISRSLTTGQVALAITLANREQAAIVQPGALISLYATADSAPLVEGRAISGSSHALAPDVRVLAVLPAAEGADRTQFGVVIATYPSTAARLAAQPVGALLATLIPPA